MNRRARAQDHWRGLPRVEHPAIPATVTINDPVGSLPETVELRALVTVFAGLNGVGKTRLLNQIAVATGGSARLISLHELCAWLTRVVKERQDLAEAVEEVDPLEVDDPTRDAVKRIVGRNYTDIKWFAIDFEDSPFTEIVGDEVVPFFIVSDGPIEYGMADMGLGELAAHVLLWTLWYVRERNDLVLLLDEPDAFFPPRSREPLLDHIATVAVTRRQAFVLTSHSREVIERALQQPNVLGYLGRRESSVELVTDAGQVREIVQQVLYPARHVELVAWVEDESAYAFTLVLLRAIDPSVVARTALYWARGAGDLDRLQATIPRPPRHERMLEFAFFVDGDQALGEEAPDRWPKILLPGGASPDAVFQDHLPNEVDSFARLVGREEQVVRAMVANLEGLDEHDWTNDITEAVGVERPQALKALAYAALRGEPGQRLVEEFRENLVASGLRIFAG